MTSEQHKEEDAQEKQKEEEEETQTKLGDHTPGHGCQAYGGGSSPRRGGGRGGGRWRVRKGKRKGKGSGRDRARQDPPRQEGHKYQLKKQGNCYSLLLAHTLTVLL